MYRYDERTADMYKHINPRFNKPIREHVVWIDIKRNGEPYGSRMTIRVGGVNGKTHAFATDGHMTFKQIVDEIIKGLKL